jgi:WD40 repeat protein
MMERLHIAVKAALILFVLAVTLVGNSLPGAAREEIRYVPQLELTDLRPIKVSFSPDDNTLLVVVNRNGRIDLFDLSNPGRPVKITEIAANAQDAIFSPKGTRRDKIKIVSGGLDGSVRLWTLDGKPAAEPFKGHEGRVYSVAFSPDGTRIISGGGDGSVRLWTLDGKPAAEPFKGYEGGLLSVTFSPDGTRIVSRGEDGSVQLLNIATRSRSCTTAVPRGRGLGRQAFGPCRPIVESGR